MPKFPVTVWLCPNCGDYFGSSSAGDLSAEWNTSKNGTPLFPRNRCPACHDMRVPCTLEIELVPKEAEGEVASESA